MTKQDVMVKVWAMAGSIVICSSKLGTQERLGHGYVPCSGSGEAMVLGSGGCGKGVQCHAHSEHEEGTVTTGVSSRLGVGWREPQGGPPEQGM